MAVDLKKMLVDLIAERDAICALSAPWRESRDAHVAQIQPLELALRDIDLKIKEIERPRLVEVMQDIASLQRALGGKANVKSLSAETGVYTKDEVAP